MNQKEYESSKKALRNLEQSLLSLKEKHLPDSPEKFELLAEPYVEKIEGIRSKIDNYTGIDEYKEAEG